MNPNTHTDTRDRLDSRGERARFREPAAYATRAYGKKQRASAKAYIPAGLPRIDPILQGGDDRLTQRPGRRRRSRRPAGPSNRSRKYYYCCCRAPVSSAVATTGSDQPAQPPVRVPQQCPIPPVLIDPSIHP